MSKRYIITERNRQRDAFHVLNEDTNGLDDIWETHIPYNLKESRKQELRPRIFDSRSDAVKYKNKRQGDSDRDWRENDWMYKSYGDSKPKWAVEEYSGDLFK